MHNYPHDPLFFFMNSFHGFSTIPVSRQTSAGLLLWKIMEFVSWDHDIPNCFWKVIQNPMVPNQQPDVDEWLISSDSSILLIPMVFPWFSHGFPMVFPWFSLCSSHHQAVPWLAPATLIAILILWPTVAPTLHLTSGEISGEQRLFTWRDVHVLLKRFYLGLINFCWMSLNFLELMRLHRMEMIWFWMWIGFTGILMRCYGILIGFKKDLYNRAESDL